MKIVADEVKIKRNRQIGTYAALIGPVVLIIGAWLGINQSGLGISLAFLIAGFIIYQVGQRLSHYGRLAEDDFNQSLKSLGDDYTLIHFSSPVSHLLIGPAGIWILVPRYVKGTITYIEERKRWALKQKGVARIFGSGLNRPGLEIVSEADSLDRYLAKNWQTDGDLAVNAALVFAGNDVKIKAKNAPVPTLHINKLRGFIKQQESKNEISPETLKSLQELFSS